MYETDTILTLKTQREPDAETGEAFPYNEVRVVGVSPVSHSHKGDWEGVDAEGVVVVPLTNFGATLDEPFGKLRTIYDVKVVPEIETPITTPKVSAASLPKTVTGPTPEDVFAEKAPGVKPEEGQSRGRTPFVSPLDDPGPPEIDGPLGKVTAADA